jgi:hypothetical protein
MVQDYPDYMQDVDRSPVQNIGYQTYGVHSVENQVCAANSLGSNIWDIPDDGYWYQIESVFFIVNHLYPFGSYIETAPNQHIPVWSVISSANDNGSSVMDMSMLGSFSVRHPVSLKFSIYNFRLVSVTWNVYANYYKYLVET